MKLIQALFLAAICFTLVHCNDADQEKVVAALGQITQQDEPQPLETEVPDPDDEEDEDSDSDSDSDSEDKPKQIKLRCDEPADPEVTDLVCEDRRNVKTYDCQEQAE